MWFDGLHISAGNPCCGCFSGECAPLERGSDQFCFAVGFLFWQGSDAVHLSPHPCIYCIISVDSPDASSSPFAYGELLPLRQAYRCGEDRRYSDARNEPYANPDEMHSYP